MEVHFLPILVLELLCVEVSPLEVRYGPPVDMVAGDDVVRSVDVDDLVCGRVQLGQLQGLDHGVPPWVVGPVLQVVKDQEVVFGVQDDRSGVLCCHRQTPLHNASESLLLFRFRKNVVNQRPRNLTHPESRVYFCKDLKVFQIKTRNLVRKKRFDIDEIPPWQWVLEGFDACVRVACLLPDFGSLKVQFFRKKVL